MSERNKVTTLEVTGGLHGIRGHSYVSFRKPEVRDLGRWRTEGTASVVP